MVFGPRGINMTRDEAIALIKQKVPSDNLCRHMVAVGAIMKELAQLTDSNPDMWELTGILHDIDLGTTDDPDRHGRIGAKWLEDAGMPEDAVHAVLAHAGHSECRTQLDYLLIAADQLSGLITACALVKGKKLSNVTTKTIKKRFKEARFAAGADREAMKKCTQAGIELDVLIEHSLIAMQSVSAELGL
jgi:uncharacterized protein